VFWVHNQLVNPQYLNLSSESIAYQEEMYILINKGLVTRCPLELRLVHIPHSQQIKPYAEFEEHKGKKFEDFNVVKEMIVQLTDKAAGKKGNIIKNPIKLTVYSNTCPDLTVIDLPGITRVPLHSND
jgi:dynamin 1-like protein